MGNELVPKVLFVDLGGVVVDVDESRAEHELSSRVRARVGECPPGSYRRSFVDSGLKHALDLGREDVDAALVQAATLVPGATPADVRAAHEAIVSVRPSMLGRLAAIERQGARLVILSNTDPIHAAFIAPRVPLAIERWVFSFDHGLEKPDPAFFTAACRLAGVAPWEAALLDDRPENLSAAAALGIVGVHFTTEPEAAEGLAALGWASS